MGKGRGQDAGGLISFRLDAMPRKRATKSNTFRWDARKTEAAQLLAEGEFSVVEIAAKIGVERTAVYRWLQIEEFAVRVAENEKRLGDISLRRVIARRNRRLLSLESRWLGMQQVIEERSKAPYMQDVAGGKTGLLVRTIKSVGSGDNAQIVEEYAVDTGLLKELREHEKQAAQECGQWTEKIEQTAEIRQRVIEEIADVPGDPGQADQAA